MNEANTLNVSLLALLVSLFPTAVSAQQPASSMLTVSWVTCIDTADPRPFFTIEVARSGVVRYIGGERVRLKGERIEQVPTEKAERIFRLANDLVVAQSRAHVSPYCLRVGFDPTGQSLGIRVPADSRPAAALRKLLDTALDTPRLVCPTPLEALIDGHYCGQRWINYSLNELDICTYRHEVVIFADGRGVYSVVGERADDFYFSLTSAQRRELAAITKRYSSDLFLMPQAPGTSGSGAKRPSPRIVTNPAQITEFKAALEHIAGIRWRTPALLARCEPRAVVEGVIALFR